MKCPVCSKTLDEHKGSYLCPAGHGAMISTKHLIEKDDKLVAEIESYKTEQTGSSQSTVHEIACPHCGNKMHKANYNATGIIIDSCMKCHYRWLDRGEYKKINEHTPNISGEDLLYLHNLGLDMKKNPADKNPNRRLWMHSSGWGGAYRGAMSGDSRRTLGAMSGAGLYAIIEGLRSESKFIKVVTVGFLVVFVILGYLIYRQVSLIKW